MLLEEEFPFGQDYDWKNRVFLGQGSYGKVFKVQNFKDQQFYAIKSMNMEEFNRDPTLMAALDGEIQITAQAKSPYSVQMLTHRIGHRFTYIVLELCDSDLRKELASRKITEPECVQIFDQIMKGFQVIVGLGYIHRDIKPANVLVKNKVHKVADFGFACKADVFGKKKLTDICGTPIYMAPQLLKNQPYTAQSDIWSLGLMLYEMIFGYTPWPCRSLEEYLNGIYTIPLRFPYNAQIGENTRDFIVRSLVIDENRRLSWQQVFQHPLIKHNHAGQETPSISVDEYVKKILLKIQNNIAKTLTNLRAIISKYRNDKINEPTFIAMVREIDLTITSHEISTLFNYLDAHKTGWLDWPQIEDKVFHVDFREQGDVLSRKLDQIIAILRARKDNPAQLFEKIDTNHSGFIDFGQFSKFIAEIAPKYSRNQVLQLFGLLDKDKNGLISKEEFTEMILKKLPSPPQHHLASARGLRNMKVLVQFMKKAQLTPEKMLLLGEEDRSAGLTKVQFKHLMNNKLKFTITTEEVDQVFDIIDKSSNGVITLDELVTMLNQQQ